MIKYLPVKFSIENKTFNKYGREILRKIKFDHREITVKLVRGFTAFGNEFLDTFRA